MYPCNLLNPGIGANLFSRGVTDLYRRPKIDRGGLGTRPPPASCIPTHTRVHPTTAIGFQRRWTQGCLAQPREQNLLKGHLARVICHQGYMQKRIGKDGTTHLYESHRGTIPVQENHQRRRGAHQEALDPNPCVRQPCKCQRFSSYASTLGDI